MAPPPIYLTILRRGDTNIVDLAETGSLIPRSETQVPETFLQELAAEVARIVTPGYSRRDSQAARSGGSRWQVNTAVQDLQRIGGLIFSHLLTESARKKLRTAETCDLYLRLDEQLIHLPWELCYDGNDFLATKFRVGRQVITGYPIPDSSTPREVGSPLRVLLIADPTESLPEAGEEAERLCALLDKVPGVEVTVLGGKGVRRFSLLGQLQAHDVVHFAGHSFYDPDHPSLSGWRLHEGALTAGELIKLTRPPLLVFSNSCQAGATTGWEGGYHYEGQAFGIGSAFLLAGVKNYIGTFWVVHDEESALFAAAFYRGLTSGLSLGEALLQARQEMLRQQGWERLTWASYMLYGDPARTLLPTQEQPSPVLGEKKRWWDWQPRLRLKMSITFSVTVATILAVMYVLNSIEDRTHSGQQRGSPAATAREVVPATLEPPTSLSQEPSQPTAVGVMDFEISNVIPQFEWMQQAIRTYLNSQLSAAPGLKVYAKEYLDFQGWQQPSTQIQIANRLGIAKVISGRFDATTDKLFIEVHIVDVQTGIQEWSTIIQGEPKAFFDLQKQIASTIMTSLHIAVSPQEKSSTGETLPAPSLDTYKLLLDAEGETPSAPKEDGPHSGPPLWKGWPIASEVWADETPQPGSAPEEEIRQVLEKYRQAYETKDLPLLEDVYGTVTPAQKEAIAKYFHNTQDLRVTLRDVDIAVRGDEAAVSCTREDQFTDTETGQQVKLDARFTKIFVRLDGTWKIAVGRK